MCIQVVFLTEGLCDGDAGQVFAPVALHGVHIEEDHQGGEKTQEHEQEHTDLQPLPVHIRASEAEGRNQPKHRLSKKVGGD